MGTAILFQLTRPLKVNLPFQVQSYYYFMAAYSLINHFDG